MKKGKLIVIDGIDGSGKATQAKILFERLNREGKKATTIDFPRYKDNFFGKLIADCLNSKHGDFLNLDPYIASVLYAADRAESKKIIREKISRGFVVISDRYMSANQIHQGGKIQNIKERRKFFKWLESMEFGVLEIPKPDVIIYLNMPVRFSLKFLKSKENLAKIKYLKERIKVYEKNIAYLERAKGSADCLLKSQKNWIKIDCVKNGKIMTKEKISDIILKKLKPIIN